MAGTISRRFLRSRERRGHPKVSPPGRVKSPPGNADAGIKFPDEVTTMDQANTSQSHSHSFPLTQRELVGLALQRGSRRTDIAPAAPHSQRDRVRHSLALGLGGRAKSTRGARRGIVR
jgi:hypothetical protein